MQTDNGKKAHVETLISSSPQPTWFLNRDPPTSLAACFFLEEKLLLLIKGAFVATLFAQEPSRFTKGPSSHHWTCHYWHFAFETFDTYPLWLDPVVWDLFNDVFEVFLILDLDVRQVKDLRRCLFLVQNVLKLKLCVGHRGKGSSDVVSDRSNTTPVQRI